MESSHQVAADGSPVGRLFEQHGSALFAYLKQQTGSREVAEDVLVEVFMAALEAESPSGPRNHCEAFDNRQGDGKVF